MFLLELINCHDCFANKRSMWEIFEECGVRLFRADANRVQGWMQVKEFLCPRQGADGASSPRLQIFSTCENLIRCLPALQHDKTDPGDCASLPHELTHLPDALRYFLRSRATPAKKEGERTEACPAAALLRHGTKNRKGRFN